MPRKLILASQSPRRQELLRLCGYPFHTEVSRVDEALLTQEIFSAPLPGETFSDQAKRLVAGLSLAKAQAVARQYGEDTLVIGSDTVVLLEDRILGKPKDEAEAGEMLRDLAGKTHQVLTGVTLLADEKAETFVSHAAVTFWAYDAFMQNLIDRYVETGSPLDKAGAYGIQDMGALLVERIEGDYYTIMGFPVAELARRMEKYLV